jgi:hypothetical protein
MFAARHGKRLQKAKQSAADWAKGDNAVLSRKGFLTTRRPFYADHDGFFH